MKKAWTRINIYRRRVLKRRLSFNFKRRHKCPENIFEYLFTKKDQQRFNTEALLGIYEIVWNQMRTTYLLNKVVLSLLSKFNRILNNSLKMLQIYKDSIVSREMSTARNEMIRDNNY